jgi:hypothetical protein
MTMHVALRQASGLCFSAHSCFECYDRSRTV